MMNRASAWAALFVLSCTLAACSKKSSESNPPRTLTQAQRDSAIAASALPGASVVGKALEVADSAEARANEAPPSPR